MIDPHDRPVLGFASNDGDVVLRAPKAADVEARFSLGVTPDIIRMFGAIIPDDTTYTRAKAEAWVESQLKAPFAFIIEHKGRLVGAVRLHSKNDHDCRATLAIGILDRDMLGQGIGTQAMTLILDHGFTTLGLHRVNLRVIEYNARAIAMYSKLGFVTEGRERQSAKVGDAYHDDVIMGLLAHEWLT